MTKYRFIHDPGHGWLEVPTGELVRLGIANQISSFSYISKDGKKVYLEEDCDLAVFAEAKCKKESIRDPLKWDAEGVEEVYQENTFVRHLAPFTQALSCE